MLLKDYVVHEINHLDEGELKQVADYLAFLKFRSRRKAPVFDEAALAALYAEFAEEDRELAEEGMEEYAQALAAEDKK